MQENPSDKDVNQGTLVVFNLDAAVTNEELRNRFGVYGEIKEVREMGAARSPDHTRLHPYPYPNPYPYPYP